MSGPIESMCTAGSRCPVSKGLSVSITLSFLSTAKNHTQALYMSVPVEEEGSAEKVCDITVSFQAMAFCDCCIPQA